MGREVADAGASRREQVGSSHGAAFLADCVLEILAGMCCVVLV